MVVAVLNVIGVVMVLSASSVQSLDSKGNAWWFFERQLLWTGLGVAGFAVASRVDYRTLAASTPCRSSASPPCCSCSC